MANQQQIHGSNEPDLGCIVVMGIGVLLAGMIIWAIGAKGLSFWKEASRPAEQVVMEKTISLNPGQSVAEPFFLVTGTSENLSRNVELTVNAFPSANVYLAGSQFDLASEFSSARQYYLGGEALTEYKRCKQLGNNPPKTFGRPDRALYKLVLVCPTDNYQGAVVKVKVTVSKP